MVEPKDVQMLTPEVVKAVAENADALKSLLRSGDEAMALGCGSDSECCCPKFLKFKFWFCNVWITNNNAKCPEDQD